MIYFTADFHYGHGNIIKYCNRPFLSDIDKKALAANGGVWHKGNYKNDPNASVHKISPEGVALMNDAIISGVNKTVGKNDTLFFLGDWCLAKDDEYKKVAAECRNRINCKDVRMVWGNHDQPVLIHDLFEDHADLWELKYEGISIVMCHYAMAAWNKSHRGSWQLYGHSHSELEPFMNKIMPGRRSIDVGIDNAAKLLGEYRPFSFEELKKHFADKPGFFSRGTEVVPIVGGPEECSLIS